MEAKRLYRSEQDRMLGGVCAGLGSYLGVDPTVVRVVFVALAFVSVGIVLYLAMWILVPSESSVGKAPPEAARESVADMRQRARQGVTEAREAVERLRGRAPVPGTAAGRDEGGPPMPEPRPAPPEPHAGGSQPPPAVPDPRPAEGGS